MTEDISWIASDDPVTRRERRRQSDYREQVLNIPAGERPDGTPLGSLLPVGDRTRNFLSEEARRYAAERVPVVVRSEGGTLEEGRLYRNLLSSMPLAFNVFGHLRAHPVAAARLLSALLDVDVSELIAADVGQRSIDRIECEWAPEREQHLDDRTAFDAVAAARTAHGRRLLVAVEVKYVDSFSRDPESKTADRKYEERCQNFGMADNAFPGLGGHATRQLLRNVLLTESVRRGGTAGPPAFDDATTVVFARDDDQRARDAVEAVAARRGSMPTDVRFIGHRQLADAASGIPELADWAAGFRRRYLGG